MFLRQFSGTTDEWAKWYFFSILIRNSTLPTLYAEMPKEMLHKNIAKVKKGEWFDQFQVKTDFNYWNRKNVLILNL